MKITLHTLQPIVILALALGLIAVAFRQAPEAPKVLDEENFIPRTEAVRYMALGHNSTAASLLWINGLISYGEGLMTGKSFRWITHLADASTRLDSLFKTPYQFIAAVTPSSELDTSDFPLMRRGVQKVHEDWQMALSFALRLSRGPTHDHLQAARIMRRYANDSTVPPYVRMIHKTFEFNMHTSEIALEMIVNDAINPDYVTFRNSLMVKAARTLNIDPHAPEAQAVWLVMNDLFARKIRPEIAHERLRALQKQP